MTSDGTESIGNLSMFVKEFTVNEFIIYAGTNITVCFSICASILQFWGWNSRCCTYLPAFSYGP